MNESCIHMYHIILSAIATNHAYQVRNMHAKVRAGVHYILSGMN